ncbi:macrolide 2'-phosphotransferase [Singulisphaera rosea]
MTLPSDGAPADAQELVALARRHGLLLTGEIEVDEVGLDFRAVFASDEQGIDWVLRIPRRPDVWPRAENEAKVLKLLKGRLPVAVPDWQIFAPELIAYPRLAGRTAVVVDPISKEPTWKIDKESPTFVASLAQALAALHRVDRDEAAASGLKVLSPSDARREFAADLERVKQDIGVGEELSRRWKTWLDDDAAWPPITTLIHGDLHVGHVVVDESSKASGILDWTEAEVSDPSIDFIFHLMGFGEEGLDRLLAEYEAAEGRIWPGMRSQIKERLSAFPIKFGLFALTSGDAGMLEAAKAQLGVGPIAG